MSESIEDQIAEAMANLKATEAAVARAEAEMRTATVTEVSRDHSVEVTVGAQGHLTDLKFLNNKYRTMGAAQLAQTIVETAGRARTQMVHRVMEAFQPVSEVAGAVPGVEGGHFNWEHLIAPLGGGAEAPRGNHTSSDRLRDEITEAADERLVPTAKGVKRPTTQENTQ